jgi:hypothetical protein
MAAANLYEPPPPSYQAAQTTNNHFAGKFQKKIQIPCGKILCRWIIETTMYVSPAQAPYEGVYQRQPAGLPKAEFIPQYPDIAPTNVNNSDIHPAISNGYPPQPAYQNNGSDGQIYVPQMNEQQVCFSFYFYDLIEQYYII